MTATNVVDDYSLNTSEIRTRAFNKEYERVAPDSDDMRFEAVEPTRVRAGQRFPISSRYLGQFRSAAVIGDDNSFSNLPQRSVMLLVPRST